MSALRVFISHASADSAFAERLADDLRRAGADVRLDASHLSEPGDFTAHIGQMLGDRDVLLLVLSPAAIASQWAPAELNAAIVRANQGLMRPPLIVQGVPVPLADVAGIWTLYQRIDLASDYPAALPHLLVALGLAATAASTTSPATASTDAAPVQPPVTPSTPPVAYANSVPPPPPSPYQPAYGAPQPAKAEGFAARTTLLFGGILAAVLSVFSLVSVGVIAIAFRVPGLGRPFLSLLTYHFAGYSLLGMLTIVIASLLAFFGGFRVALRSGRLGHSLLAGMGIAVIGFLVSALVGDVVTYLQISRSVYFIESPLSFILRTFMYQLVFVIVGGAFGLGAGALGGLAGRSRALAGAGDTVAHLA